MLEPHAGTIPQGQGGWDFFPTKIKIDKVRVAIIAASK